ncbi:MAG: polyamine aminopropyltransferase [Hyphomicrobiales bacterium]
MSDPDYITRDSEGRQWFTETLHGDFLTSYEISRVLFDSRTPHQRLIVADSVRFGRLVALDGVTQLTMADEPAYHEMLAHVPILAHGGVEDVLIIGGGDGGMAEEVLKHKGVKRLVMVEIDAGVIDFAREHLGELHRNCFDDPRFELVIADGKDYAANAGDSFDLVIVDSTDPIGPGEVLFTRGFYADCKGLLKRGGILVTQNGVPFFQADELRNTVFNFARLFADAGCYLTVVPTYVGGFMALGWGTDDEALRDVSLVDLERRYKAADLDTRYYTPQAHKGAFALPRFIEDIVDAATREARE